MNTLHAFARSLLPRDNRQWRLAVGLGFAAAMAAVGASGCAAAAGKSQEDFATAEQAADALVAAERRDDQRELLRILGPGSDKLIHSGDPVADRKSRQRLIDAYDRAHRIEADGTNAAALVVGPEDWSLPLPIIRRGERWHFDTAAGEQKIIDRRVGRNELNVIEVCRAYVAAQREYASKDRLGDGLHEFATKIASSPGQHDGLYWPAAADEEQSPFGPLVASARAEGYTSSDHHVPVPYHGYYFRIITRQGPHAPGGAKDYLVAGHMTGGFALLASPAKWGDSGIMTFVVNQHGIVFQKNLGPDTARLARDIQEFDPDLSWRTP
jgi:hypothetical protein